ncbi:MAG: hypothetical protein ACK5Z5_02515 [Neisseriaceae bacterium]|jgi:hypothetical protein
MNVNGVRPDVGAGNQFPRGLNEANPQPIERNLFHKMDKATKPQKPLNERIKKKILTDIQNITDGNFNKTITFSLDDMRYSIDNLDFILQESLEDSQDIENWCLLHSYDQVVTGSTTRFYTMMCEESLLGLYVNSNNGKLVNPTNHQHRTIINLETHIISFKLNTTQDTPLNLRLQLISSEKILQEENLRSMSSHFSWGVIWGLGSAGPLLTAFIVGSKLIYEILNGENNCLDDRGLNVLLFMFRAGLF